MNVFLKSTHFTPSSIVRLTSLYYIISCMLIWLLFYVSMVSYLVFTPFKSHNVKHLKVVISVEILVNVQTQGVQNIFMFQSYCVIREWNRASIVKHFLLTHEVTS